MRYTPGIIKDKVPEGEVCWKKFARAGMGILMMLPWGLIGLIFMETRTSNAYVLLIFESTIPTLGAGIALFFFTDYINRKIGILKLEAPDVRVDEEFTNGDS